MATSTPRGDRALRTMIDHVMPRELMAGNHLSQPKVHFIDPLNGGSRWL
jgi:hypothetical protein